MRKSEKRKKQQRFQAAMMIMMAVVIIGLSFLSVFLGIRVKKLERQVNLLRGSNNKSVEIVWSEDDVFLENENEDDDEAKAGKEDTEGKKKVYLTFDDGPSIYTEEILKILREYNVKATFFVTGTQEAKYRKWYKKIIEEGHTLGIHTYSHVYNDIYASLEAFQMDFNKLRNQLYDDTGEWVNLYRFPGGSGNNVLNWKNRQTIMEWMDSENIVYFDWNLAPEETGRQEPTAQQIATNCIEGVKRLDTAMVLLHDASGRKSTIEALPLIIEGIHRLEDTILLPIDEETVTFQQISLTKE